MKHTSQLDWSDLGSTRWTTTLASDGIKHLDLITDINLNGPPKSKFHIWNMNESHYRDNIEDAKSIYNKI